MHRCRRIEAFSEALVSRQAGEPRWRGTPNRFSAPPFSRLDELLPDRWKELQESAGRGDRCRARRP